MASQLPVKWSAFGQKLPKYQPALSCFESDMYQLNTTCFEKSLRQRSIATVAGVANRVAELGSLPSGAKMAMKIFVKRVVTIFASNASFLRVIANLQN